MSKETNVHVSDCTINHCIPQMNSQWSTAEGIMVLGTTLTFITMYSKLLQVENGCTVVYFERAVPQETTGMEVGTPLTSVTRYSKLLGPQSGPSVVYFK